MYLNYYMFISTAKNKVLLEILQILKISQKPLATCVYNHSWILQLLLYLCCSVNSNGLRLFPLTNSLPKRLDTRGFVRQIQQKNTDYVILNFFLCLKSCQIFFKWLSKANAGQCNSFEVCYGFCLKYHPTISCVRELIES